MARRDYATNECLHCKREIFQNRRGTKKYCSDKCRMSASRKRNKPRIRGVMCEMCNKTYYPTMPLYLCRYCSNACRQKAYRESKKLA